MDALGIDLGKHEFAACLIAPDGKKIASPKLFSNDEVGVQKMLNYFQHEYPAFIPTQTQIGMESTATYWVNLYDRLEREGFQMTLLNPIMVKGLRNVSVRSRKTDKDNAQHCALSLILGKTPVTVRPSEIHYELRELCRFRAELVKDVASLKNRTLSILDRLFPEFPTLFSNTFGPTAMALLHEAASPEELLKLNTSKLTKLLKKYSRSHLGAPHARHIKEHAANSFASSFAANVLNIEVHHLVELISFTEKHIKELDTLIAEKYAALNIHLESIPGIGIYSAASIISEYGDISRFKSKDAASKMVAFAGIDATITESAKTEKKRRMSKKGSTYLRTVLYNASRVAAQIDPMFRSVFEKQINCGKSYKVAVSHVMRKMVHVVYAILRDNRPYKLSIV